MRQYDTRSRQRREPVKKEQARMALKQGPQGGGPLEVVAFMARSWLNFEKQDLHDTPMICVSSRTPKREVEHG
jgi:hypothetical protein